jgi:L-ascorbate metabolism protein UlaG (beta-lactamase superfamily)
MNSKLILCTLALVLTSGVVSRADDTHRNNDAALVHARQMFFGAENVNPQTGEVRKDKVLFSWMTNTTYAVAMKGKVILLDSFVTRLEVAPGRTPFVIQDIVDLNPEMIFLGHGHGDHADNAAFIAGTLNIPIISTPETCDVMQLDAARIFGAGRTVNCIGAVSRGSAPGAEVNKLNILEPVASVTVFKHIHSGLEPHDPAFPQVTIQNIPDPRDASLFPLGTPLSNVQDIRTTGFGGSAGAISLFYQFVLNGDNNFTFIWHNTTGPLKELGPQLFDIMDALPPTDVEFGSVVSLGFTTNGERDIVMYNQHIKPKVFIPGHVTAVAVESSSLEWKVGYSKQLDAMSVPQDQRPEVRWMVDPTDYLRPLVFDPSDKRWAKNGHGN